MKSILIKNGIIVTANGKKEIIHGDIRFKDGVITEIASKIPASRTDEVIDAGEAFVIPGLIQTHVHLCQILFRGMADDLELLDWLKERIWPLEAAHDEDSLRASARIGLMEMQLLGTTSILDMGTVRLHEVVFEEAHLSGMRYWGGNCLMDRKSSAGPLFRDTEETLEYCEKLIQDWHLKTPLIQYAISPRFVISCTDKILKAARSLQNQHGLIFHTHASENKGEVELVKKRTGMDNVKFLNHIGCLNEKTVIAHGIHLKSNETKMMIKARAGLAHCPSSNLKLASGIAPIEDYINQGMKVGLGADGAPCNNMMDPFMEMRLAALLQKPENGPTALNAQTAFELATIRGAEVLAAADKIGSIEVGKRADIVIVDRQHPSVATVDDPYSALVYSCSGRDVRDVWVDGNRVVQDKKHLLFDCAKEIKKAREQLVNLRKRAKI